MWKNIVEPGRPQITVWRVCSPCWIPKFKDMYSEYVKVIAFPLQQWMQERSSVLRYTFITCLIIHSLRSCPIFLFQKRPRHGLYRKTSVQMLHWILFVIFYNRGQPATGNCLRNLCFIFILFLDFFTSIDVLFNHQSVQFIFLNFPATISLSSISFKILRPLFQSSFFVSLYLPFFQTLCLCLLPPSYAKPKLQVGRFRVRFPMVSLQFFVDILPAAIWPWGRLSL